MAGAGSGEVLFVGAVGVSAEGATGTLLGSDLPTAFEEPFDAPLLDATSRRGAVFEALRRSATIRAASALRAASRAASRSANNFFVSAS